MALNTFLKKIFFHRKKAASVPAAQEKAQAEKALDELLKKARKRLHGLLITRRTAQGSIKKTRHWELFRTGPGLFRIDAEGVSLVLNTASFLIEKAEPEKKIQGLLRTTEMALCEAAESSGGLSEFLQFMEPPPDPKSQAVFLRLLGKSHSKENVLPAFSELFSWEPFDLDQMLVRNSLNTLAHVLIHADPKLELLLRSRLSLRLRWMLIEELESLLVQESSVWQNPHRGDRPLREFEAALLEFRQNMQSYLWEKSQKERRKKAREIPSVPPGAKPASR